MSEKINRLLNTIVPGDIVIQSWLSSHGITLQLARNYCESKWLVRLGVGALQDPKREKAISLLEKTMSHWLA